MFRFAFPVVVVTLLFSVGCGDMPSAPSAIPTEPAAPAPAPSSSSPATVTKIVTSIETGQPIAGAVVRIGSVELRTDDRGQVAVRSDLGPRTDTTISADGYSSRRTLNESNTFSLWVNRPDFDENFLKALVYAGASNNYHPIGTAYLRLSNEVRSDSAAVDALRRGVDQINGAIGERAVELSDPPPGAVVFNVQINSGIATSGLTYWTISGARVTGGTVEFRTMREAQLVPLVVHELAHASGLNGHNPGVGLMSPVIGAGVRDFTASERLSLKIRTRPSGVAFVDDDRTVLAATQALATGGAETRTATISCRVMGS